MAKKAKTAKKVKVGAKKAKSKAPAAEKPQFGIDYVAKKSGLQPATVRVGLRRIKAKRTGKLYDFGSAAGADKIVKQLTKKAA